MFDAGSPRLHTLSLPRYLRACSSRRGSPGGWMARKVWRGESVCWLLRVWCDCWSEREELHHGWWILNYLWHSSKLSFLGFSRYRWDKGCDVVWLVIWYLHIINIVFSSLDAKLAIAITANFKNNWTQEENEVEEIGGIARQYDQDFFKEMNTQTGVDLENIVYYKDEVDQDSSSIL